MLKVAITLFVGILLWEHFGRINEIDLRPTPLIGNVTQGGKKIFIRAGNYGAWFCSYLYHMHLKEMAYSFWGLATAVAEFLLVPVWSIKGFIESAYNDYGSPYVIYTGGVLLVALFVGIVAHYHDKIPLLRSIDFSRVGNFLSDEENKRRLFLLVVISGFVIATYYGGVIYPTLNITR